MNSNVMIANQNIVSVDAKEEVLKLIYDGYISLSMDCEKLSVSVKELKFRDMKDIIEVNLRRLNAAVFSNSRKSIELIIEASYSSMLKDFKEVTSNRLLDGVFEKLCKDAKKISIRSIENSNFNLYSSI